MKKEAQKEHLGDRIRAGLEAHPNGTQAWLARELTEHAGKTIRPQQVHKWIQYGKISREYLVLIAKVLNLRTHWILTGDGPMLDGVEQEGRKIPLIRWEELANMEEAAKQADSFTVVDSTLAKKLSPRGVSVKPGDASMSSNSKDGIQIEDTMVVDPDIRPVPGCIVIVKLDDGAFTMGYYEPHTVKGDHYTIEPANKKFPKFEVPNETEAEIVAVVYSIIRNVMPGH